MDCGMIVSWLFPARNSAISNFFMPSMARIARTAFRLVGITHHIRQDRREYLPGDAELIIEPAALVD
jgi:hypothetical protein